MIVMDSCFAVEIALGTERAKGYQKLMTTGERVVSTNLLYGEVTSTFWRYARNGLITADEAIKLAGRAIDLVDEFVDIKELYTEALYEAIRLSHSPYDMMFFVLARRTHGTLFTLDKRLAKLALQNGLNCVYKCNVDGSPWTIRADNGDLSELYAE